MSEEKIQVCSDCGLAGLKSQFDKTKGKCPRCNPDEEQKFLQRRAFRSNPSNRGKPIPQDIA